MKQCKNCSIEFEPKHLTRGHEQVYCSIKCRTQSYNNRIMNKRQDNEKVHEIKDDIGVNIQRSENRVNQMGNYMPHVNLEILEGKYQAKTEALEYKLRYEQSQKELESLRIKVMELENELEEYDIDGEGESDSYMGSIMDIAKTSPELGNAIGKLLQNEKVQNFVINLIPDTAQKQ